ncbi:MAG: carboxypeptidase-like regulatory domain-containing protein [Bacteroidales bacterium]|nr:carboxypeptidase-like regulatory domain-containing protein [Bacteroidales bacterium]
MKHRIILFIAICFSFHFVKAERIITGKVTDESGTGLIGVSVVLKSTSSGTFTDVYGDFRIELPDSNATLVFSYVGYNTQELKVTTESHYTIVLAEDIESLDEVVVVGHGSRLRMDLSGAISSVRSIRRESKRVTESEGVSVSMEFDDVSRSDFKKSSVSSRLLTAGEVNDFGKWKLWDDLNENEFKDYSDKWRITPFERYSVQVMCEDKMPVVNAVVRLVSEQGINVWSARTDNTGKAELWNNMFADSLTAKFKIEIEYAGKLYEIQKAKKFGKGINKIKLPLQFKVSNKVEIAFMVDATASMADEIQYLKAELNDIITRVNDTLPDIDLKTGCIFYRDRTDAYVTRVSDLNEKTSETVKFIKENGADGGGDYPEALDAAMADAMQKMSWSDSARTRIMFVLLDAPPHENKETFATLQKTIKAAAMKGIRIVPVTCSGINKSTEFLMRAMALATNGTYTFLTDDSGIGDAHIKPSTDKYEVELLNDLLLRIFYTYCFVPEKEVIEEHIETIKSDSVQVEIPVVLEEEKDKPVKVVCYPNPTTGPLTIQSEGFIKEVYIADITGKILERIQLGENKRMETDLSVYPDGIYFVRYVQANDSWSTEKIIHRK